MCARPTITPQNRLKRALRSERCRSRIFNRPRRFPATSIARFKHLDRNKTARPHRSMTAWGTQGESEIHWAPHAGKLSRNKRVIYQFWSKRAPSGDCNVTFMEEVELIRMHSSGDPGIFPSYTRTFTDVAVSDVSARYP